MCDESSRLLKEHPQSRSCGDQLNSRFVRCVPKSMFRPARDLNELA